jgi:hypothetical protein
MKSSAAPPPPAPGPVPTQPDDVGAQLLKEARELADKNDIDGAHDKLGKVPENSPVRDDAQFKAIEGKWADAQFEKAQAATDPVEKRRILNSIAATPTVDADRRRRAADMLQQVEPAVPEPVTPRYVPPSTGGGQYVPPTPATPGHTPEPPTPSVKATDPKPVDVPAAPGDLQNESIRKSLSAKVWSGKATESEIRTLKAACSALGDRACRDRAAAELAKKKAGG